MIEKFQLKPVIARYEGRKGHMGGICSCYGKLEELPQPKEKEVECKEKVFWHYEEEQPSLTSPIKYREVDKCMEHIRRVPFYMSQGIISAFVCQAWNPKTKKWIPEPAYWVTVNTKELEDCIWPPLPYQVHIWYDPELTVSYA